MMGLDLSPLEISLATTVTATAATFAVGLVAAWRMLGLRSRARAWLDGLMTLPLVLPPTVVGYFLLLLFGRHSPIGALLERVGITIVFSWPATVIAATVVAFPLMYRTTLGAFEQVSPALLDAARTLGASESRVFRKVLVPLAAPGILAGAVLAFARALGEFGATLMLAGNIPGHTQTLPIAIFSAVEGGDLRAAYLWVALLVLISVGMIRLLHQPRRVPSERNRPSDAGASQAGAPRPATAASRLVPERAGANLRVDLTKALASFCLEARFETRGRVVGLLGESGAGKTMIFRLIAGIERPDRGRIELHGRCLFDSERGIALPASERRIGIVFQDYALFPHLTVAENILFALDRRPASERRERLAQLLALLQMQEFADRLPRELSGGQRQRAAIARALAPDPEALLFDEPFSALDPHLRRSTEELLRSSLRGFAGAILFVTHDMEEAFRFCDELAVVHAGKLSRQTPKHALFANPQSVHVARLTGCKNIAPARRRGPDLFWVEDWGCPLRLAAPTAEPVAHLGYRSHQFEFVSPETTGENTFPCWLVELSEAPHEVTLYLRLHREPQPGEGAQVQADLAKPTWAELQRQPQPWRLRFVAEQILALE